MAAIELYKEDGKPAGVYFCESCRVVYADKEQAEWCHRERLCACGKKVTQGYFKSKCSDCDRVEWKEKERKKEAERFEAAVKIPVAEYKGEMVYLDDHYYDSVESAIYQFLEGQEPEYVWACKDQGVPRADLEDLLYNIIDNMWEDADQSDLNGVDELDAAIKAFNEANKSISVWFPDYSTAILVEKSTPIPSPPSPL